MILYILTHIHFSVSKSNFHFKGRSGISTDSFNKINVGILQFNIVNFQIKQFYHFPEIYLEFSLANLGCNYWNNLPVKVFVFFAYRKKDSCLILGNFYSNLFQLSS